LGTNAQYFVVLSLGSSFCGAVRLAASFARIGFSSGSVDQRERNGKPADDDFPDVKLNAEFP
jgi:hypothetical protein